MSLIDETHSLTVNIEPPLDTNGSSLFRDTVRREIAARHEECLRWFCLHPHTPEDVLLEIYESGLCLIELGHRQAPRSLVDKMANESKYPEAIVTLAIQLYTAATESDHAFEQFALQHGDNQWMLDTLIRRAASSNAKESLLERLIVDHPQAEHLTHLRKTTRWARQAAASRDVKEMEDLYARNEPSVWLALAQNPFAPPALLERLAKVTDVRLARRIRNSANDSLRMS